jgi:hypothetical protein
LDFESDRRALEDFIDSRVEELGIEELSVENFMELAFEYFEANPVPDATIRTAREAMTYNRLTGEIDYWHKLPWTELYWRPEHFFNDVWQSVLTHRPGLGVLSVLNLRRWLEYFGLVDPKEADDFYMYGRE